jgi:hypothetical protein
MLVNQGSTLVELYILALSHHQDIYMILNVSITIIFLILILLIY